ncbi:hypothetical protein BASA81_001483 [Batrachochytrium salamandrivorans]|nr:hypothetical protein BASA81_001483 [Batrachochytrium salamandrivorans]
MALRRGGAEESAEAKEFGVVVALKDQFGFLRQPSASGNKREEDIFFHLDDLRPKSTRVEVGDEFSFTIKSKMNAASGQKRTSAVGMIKQPKNEMFRHLQLPRQVGQVVQVENGGGGGILECAGTKGMDKVRFEAITPTAKVGDLCAFKACMHPLHRWLVAVESVVAFPASSTTQMLGNITQADMVETEGEGSNKAYKFVSSLQIKVGDKVWMQVSGDLALVTSICVPNGVTAGAAEEDDQILLSWLEDKGEEETELKRQTGRVLTVKDGQFAFCSLDGNGKEQVYMHWSELCTSPFSPPTNNSGLLRVGDYVSFQVQQRRDNLMSGVEGGAAIANKNRVCFQADNTGTVILGGNNQAFVDFVPISLDLWKRIHPDADTRVPIEGNVKKLVHGQSVNFDDDGSTQTRFGVCGCAEKAQASILCASNGWGELGMVTAQPGVLVSCIRADKITFNAREFPQLQAEDLVKFKLTKDLLVVDLVPAAETDKTSLLGLRPLSNNNEPIRQTMKGENKLRIAQNCWPSYNAMFRSNANRAIACLHSPLRLRFAAVEKECKRLGLYVGKLAGSTALACGKDKSQVDLWAKFHPGAKIRVAPAATAGEEGKVVAMGQFVPGQGLTIEVEMEGANSSTSMLVVDDTVRLVKDKRMVEDNGEFRTELQNWITFALAPTPWDALWWTMIIYSYRNLVSSASGDVFPVEGDEVEFTPCVSQATGRLRATDVRIVAPQQLQARTEGVVEELRGQRGGGGWIRPTGLPSVRFDSSDVVSKPLSLGDVVDFVLTKDHALQVRFLRHGTLVPAVATTPPPSSKTPPPSRFTKSPTLSATTPGGSSEDNGNKIAMPANYLAASGPDEDYAVVALLRKSGASSVKFSFLAKSVPLRPSSYRKPF